MQIYFKNAAILSEWSGLRPGRYGGIRLEMTTVRFPVPRTRSLRNSGERVVQVRALLNLLGFLYAIFANLISPLQPHFHTYSLLLFSVNILIARIT